MNIAKQTVWLIAIALLLVVPAAAEEQSREKTLTAEEWVELAVPTST